MSVKEWQNDVIFLHTIVPGVAGRSYGIHVAGLAGLPRVVINRAKTILSRLERGDTNSIVGSLADGLSICKETEALTQSKESLFLDEFRGLKLDDMTPNDALNVLYRLQSLAQDEDQ
jgi:DNA mismatch repair protein MutS